MVYILLGLPLLLALLAFGRWALTAEPARVARVLRVAGIAGGLGLVGYTLLRMQPMSALFFLFAVLGPALFRMRRIRDWWNAQRGPSPGQSSGASTSYLRMSLDHDSGAVSGTVLQGQFRGMHLHEMSLGQLQELLRECRVDDPDSARLLEAYLDRVHGAAWDEAGGAGSGARTGAGADSGRSRTGAGGARGGSGERGGMTLEEARAILGVPADASPEAIRDAHRSLMLKNHPDRGGSSYLAAQINRAKDLLLGE